MVECRNELDLIRKEHAVAEHVARHVSDPDAGERIPIGVEPELAEVAAQRFPRPTRRDAELLVIVAGGAAGGEGVVQPEPIVPGQRVGDI